MTYLVRVKMADFSRVKDKMTNLVRIKGIIGRLKSVILNLLLRLKLPSNPISSGTLILRFFLSACCCSTTVAGSVPRARLRLCVCVRVCVYILI